MCPSSKPAVMHYRIDRDWTGPEYIVCNIGELIPPDLYPRNGDILDFNGVVSKRIASVEPSGGGNVSIKFINDSILLGPNPPLMRESVKTDISTEIDSIIFAGSRKYLISEIESRTAKIAQDLRNGRTAEVLEKIRFVEAAVQRLMEMEKANA